MKLIGRLIIPTAAIVISILSILQSCETERRICRDVCWDYAPLHPSSYSDSMGELIEDCDCKKEEK